MSENLLQAIYDKYYRYIWLFGGFLVFIACVGNAWTLITLLFSDSRLKNFKLYFYITFIDDFLMVLIFGTNQILENMDRVGGWSGIENKGNFACKISR